MRDRDEPLRCDGCRGEIGPAERVYRVRVYRTYAARPPEPRTIEGIYVPDQGKPRSAGVRIEVRCGACLDDADEPDAGLAELRSLRGVSYAEHLRREVEARPCGACGRPVVRARDGRHGERVYCDDRCRREILLAERRKRRAAGRSDLTCETCGESFEASRSDARYCSSACRQKAYREREAG